VLAIVTFSVNGYIKGGFEDYIYLKFDNNIDSVLVIDDFFEFNGEISRPRKATLFPEHPSSKKMMGLAPFMLENSDISIFLHYDESDFRGEKTKFLTLDSVSGSKSQDLKNNFDSILKQTFYNESNDSIKKIILYDNLYKFIKNNPKSSLSGSYLSSLNNNNSGYLNSNQMENLYVLLDTSFQEKRDLHFARSIINRRKTLAIGSIIPSITLPNQTGTLINSNSLKENYVLIEFWASWCIPCRNTNPELLKVYNTFENKGFEILGISIDKDNKKWEAAIKEDQLKWMQLIDTLNTSMELYHLTTVPYNVLLNEKNEILARNIKPTELNEYLSQQIK
jgi:peroxiredoxin